MAVTLEIINQIKNDFYQGPDHETLQIEQGRADAFWQWFRENSSVYKPTASKEEFLSKDYLPGQCFGNSQILAYESGLNYMEGFAIATNRYIFHGFNLKSGEAVDVTAFNFENDFKEHFGGLPVMYVGLEVSSDLIKQENEESIINKSKNIGHLIYKLFSAQNNAAV
ncbi:MAG TPA: hypothetical protein VNW95_09325 [Mucilaginibacter sp.]|jgi:hypothetical protein|nr:hypothetical protein [Mucilaginibacter sp.]